ncbi:flagellar hook-associated protein FlgL [bacterium]|nr:flagellar hook-associated protein FlgL [bacterium]MBU1638471.1 flagellar hook-associated protein FlgL [bacterium]MBU1921380.1 flagellar hook-associated protein FlgL [bacterium]
MRVSDSQRYQHFTRDIEDRLSNFVRLEQELAQGKRIFNPSEDVQMAKQAMQVRSNLAQNEQYVRNIEDGSNMVSSATSHLQNVIDLLNEIDALAVAADNDHMTETDRHNNAVQMNQKIESLVESVNASQGDRYLFGGYNTNSAPFSIVRDEDGKITGVSVNEETIGGQIYRSIDRDENLRINIPGDRLFQPVGAANTDQDMFYVASQLRDVIDNNNVPPEGQETTHSNDALREKLSLIRDRVITEQTYLGSVGQRLNEKLDYYQEIEISLTEKLEDAQGVDMADLASRIAIEENVYNSLLAINSRLLGRSLVDYLS